MARMEIQYHFDGKEYKHDLMEGRFSDEGTVTYDRNSPGATPWFMNVALLQDIVAEDHNFRYGDNALGENIVIRIVKLF